MKGIIVLVLALLVFMAPALAESFSGSATVNDSAYKCVTSGGVDYIYLPSTKLNPRILTTGYAAPIDPYILKINNVKYYFIKDGVHDYRAILGHQDKKENLFESLLALDSDGDFTKITGAELQKAQVRLVPLENGKLAINDRTKDFDVRKIDYVDTKNIRESINNGTIGTMGYFDAYIGAKKIIGQVTFEDQKKLESYL